MKWSRSIAALACLAALAVPAGASAATQSRAQDGAQPRRGQPRPGVQRHRLQPVDVTGIDPGRARHDLDPAGAQPVRDAALLDLLRARHLRLDRRSARLPGRLLHAGRRPRRAARRRRHQRRGQRLQPVRRRRLRGHRQLLAVAVEPDDQRRRLPATPPAYAPDSGDPYGPGLRELGGDLGGLPGRPDAQRDHQRQPGPAGLLRRLEPANNDVSGGFMANDEVNGALDFYGQQQFFVRNSNIGVVEQRRLEPGVHGRQRRSGDELHASGRPVHQRRHDARSPRRSRTSTPTARGAMRVFVPAVQQNSVGPSYASGTAGRATRSRSRASSSRTRTRRIGRSTRRWRSAAT